MLILAGVSIATLTGENGLLTKVRDAKLRTELESIREEAELVKMEALIESRANGKSLTQGELVDALNENFTNSTKNGNSVITEDGKYKITVDEDLNITVGENGENEEIIVGPQLNQFGFYYEKLYSTTFGGYKMGYVFHEGETVDMFSDLGLGGELFYQGTQESGVKYELGKITVAQADGSELVGTIENNGTTMEGKMGDVTVVVECDLEKELHGIYKGVPYEATVTEGVEGNTVEILYSIMLNTDNTVIMTGTTVSGGEKVFEVTGIAKISANGYQVETTFEGQTALNSLGYSSVSGESVYLENGMIFRRAGLIDTTILKGAKITPVEGSSMENIMAGNPMQGDTVEYDGYIYKYNQVFAILEWRNIEAVEDRVLSSGWGVRVQDDTLASYPDMQSNVYGIPVTNLVSTYIACSNMTKAPKLSSEAINMTMAFTNCYLLDECVIPEKVEDLSVTFAGCAFVKTPELPDNIKNMDSTFEGCEKLTQIEPIPEGVTYMGSTFMQCKALKEAPDIPSTVTNLNYTFYQCDALEDVQINIPSGVTQLARTFYECTSLKTPPTIPENIENMSETFYGCTKLETAPNIPSKVTSLFSTFEKCVALEKAPTIPESVTSMKGTFEGCTSLTGNITINAKNFASTTNYSSFLQDTVLPIKLIGECPLAIRQEIAKTANNGNATAE